MTPFLLAEIAGVTEGRSLTANIALIKNNAGVGAAIALAYIRRGCQETGTALEVEAAGRLLSARVTSLPFVEYEPKA